MPSHLTSRGSVFEEEKEGTENSSYDINKQQKNLTTLYEIFLFIYIVAYLCTLIAKRSVNQEESWHWTGNYTGTQSFVSWFFIVMLYENFLYFLSNL